MPPSACSKRPRRSVGAGERALLVAEQLRLEQLGGDRRGVERDERLVRARDCVVQRARDQLLAGARFAGDQHRHARARQAADGAEHLLHRGRLAEQLAESSRLGCGLRAAAALRWRAARAHELDGLVDVERLRQVFERAALVGGHRAVEVRVRGHHDDRQRRVASRALRRAGRCPLCPACGCR